MTAYFCWRCKSKDHWANEVCPKTLGLVSPEGVATPSRDGKKVPHVNEPVVDRGESVRNAQHETAGPVEQAREFIKKVRGRPKVYPDRATQMRELMRKKRAKEKMFGVPESWKKET